MQEIEQPNNNSFCSKLLGELLPLFDFMRSRDVNDSKNDRSWARKITGGVRSVPDYTPTYGPRNKAVKCGAYISVIGCSKVLCLSLCASHSRCECCSSAKPFHAERKSAFSKGKLQLLWKSTEKRSDTLGSEIAGGFNSNLAHPPCQPPKESNFKWCLNETGFQSWKAPKRRREMDSVCTQ